MGGIERFEDIEEWKAARELTKQIYSVSKEGQFSRDYGLQGQIQKATTSIMANIAEGFDSDREFSEVLGYALRSTTEVQSHLYFSLDQGYISEHQFKSLYDHTLKVKNLISGFIRYLRGEINVEPSIVHHVSKVSQGVEWGRCQAGMDSGKVKGNLDGFF